MISKEPKVKETNMKFDCFLLDRGCSLQGKICGQSASSLMFTISRKLIASDGFLIYKCLG